jgi:hypothetical protein
MAVLNSRGGSSCAIFEDRFLLFLTRRLFAIFAGKSSGLRPLLK